MLFRSGITIQLSRKYGYWINSIAITMFVVNARFAIGPRLVLRRDASGSVQASRQFSLPGWTLHEKGAGPLGLFLGKNHAVVLDTLA